MVAERYNLASPTTAGSRGTSSFSFLGGRIDGSVQLLALIILFPLVSFVLLFSYDNLISTVLPSMTNHNAIGNSLEDMLHQFKIANKSQEAAYDDDTELKQDANNHDRMNQVKNDNANYKLAGLSCQQYGGPDDNLAQEMVYWQDIPSDANHISPLKPADKTFYLTFEPDEGGWNNIRMAMETVLGMAFAMGRTLVLPPESEMYLLQQKKHKVHGVEQRNKFTFSHFFHMEAVHQEHPGLDIISMQEFLQREAMKGHMMDTKTGKVSFPPGNRTDWDGASDKATLFQWLRSVAVVPLHWDPEKCLAVFPASKNTSDLVELQKIRDVIVQEKPNFETYIDHPVPIDASPLERMKEHWAGRKDICLYDDTLQAAKFIHFPVDRQIDARLLTHFYAFLFFQNYKQDLWMKRFIRDHIRYIDEIQCAAARIVAKVRERAIRRDPVNNAKGTYDAFHVRRGDFQYKSVFLEPLELLKMAKKKIPAGASVYIATDEHTKAYFRPLMEHYHIMFMDDFEDELKGVNSNYFGMIDVLVASRSRIFYGCWFSTFTGYINRLRGYHASNAKLRGYETGRVDSYYYALADRFDHMQHYYPVKQSFYAREFPTAWRLLDTTVNDPI